MNAVEFNAIVRNGHIALTENQQSWDGKNIKVILLDASNTVPMVKLPDEDDFFSAAGIWAHRDDVTQESLRRAAWRNEPN